MDQEEKSVLDAQAFTERAAHNVVKMLGLSKKE
jgi:hypothetical protein